MTELFSGDRKLYAPAFYHGSCSFAKYLSDKYGIDVLLSAISVPREEMQTIESLSGKSLADLKQEWLQKLNLQR
jgi:hypothetical protein